MRRDPPDLTAPERADAKERVDFGRRVGKYDPAAEVVVDEGWAQTHPGNPSEGIRGKEASRGARPAVDERDGSRSVGLPSLVRPQQVET